MARNLPISMNGIGKKILGTPILPATKKLKLADPATETIRSGITAAKGGFFCYFSCPSRKVKRKVD
jgi:hypothetical protein